MRTTLEKKQIEIFKDLQREGYNIVTCGDCGTVLLHRTNSDDDKIECFECNNVMDLCDCPDLWY